MKLETMPITFETSAKVKSEAKFELVELLVSVGSEVKEGDVLAVIETEKATADIESPMAGRVHEIFLKAGETYHHGDVLCAIETA